MSRSWYRDQHDVRVTNEPLAQQYLTRWPDPFPDLEDEAFDELDDRLNSSLPARSASGSKPAAAGSLTDSSSVVGESARGTD